MVAGSCNGCTGVARVNFAFNSDSYPEFGICVPCHTVEREGLECYARAVSYLSPVQSSEWLITVIYSISTSTPPLSSIKYSWNLVVFPN